MEGTIYTYVGNVKGIIRDTGYPGTSDSVTSLLVIDLKGKRNKCCLRSLEKTEDEKRSLWRAVVTGNGMQLLQELQSDMEQVWNNYPNFLIACPFLMPALPIGQTSMKARMQGFLHDAIDS